MNPEHAPESPRQPAAPARVGRWPDLSIKPARSRKVWLASKRLQGVCVTPTMMWKVRMVREDRVNALSPCRAVTSEMRSRFTPPCSGHGKRFGVRAGRASPSDQGNRLAEDSIVFSLLRGNCRYVLLLGVVLAQLCLFAERSGAAEPPRLQLLLPLGHSFAVNSVALSGDGSRILTGSWTGLRGCGTLEPARSSPGPVK